MRYYYAPWQYELRGHLPTPRQALTAARVRRIPDPVTGTVLAGAYFLAYAPLLQPSPPAKTPQEGTLPIWNVGGFVV
jgi:hypothetical protein